MYECSGVGIGGGRSHANPCYSKNMSENAAATTRPLFDEVYTQGARLFSTHTPPPIDTVTAGDLIICADTWGINDYVEAATERGAHVRVGPYRWEQARITRQRSRELLTTHSTDLVDADKPVSTRDQVFVPATIDAFRTTFKVSWDALSTAVAKDPTYTPAADLIPTEWVDYLPFPTLNPAQVQAAPHLLGDDPLLVVAPTGAGKTQIGMLAALKAIKGTGKKAAWLVPQRSLTAELDRELDTWRAKDINVIALSGEARTDVEATKRADLWVATTEKFEALCRSASMREAIAEIGVIVVDEIHLLGEPQRGPLLENLLARIRATDGTVRLVGLSATAANAQDVADWLGANLLTVTWRPTRQNQQIISLPVGSSRDEAKFRSDASAAITQQITNYGGSTLVFCGTKRNVRHTAVAIAKSRGVDVEGIDVNDESAVRAACDQARVGLHYSDWPGKRDAEAAFRDRRIDVLVATSTLAAGVNTPARAVVVRDTVIGLGQSMEISMVQQMFGRAGRAGKEPEGWSFLLAGLNETSSWRTRLADGYTIRSGILGGVEEHLLGEITQQNIRTRRDAEQWWARTLAYHQGSQDMRPLDDAHAFLMKWKFIDINGDGDDATYEATPLGLVTSRMMINVRDAAALMTSVKGIKGPTGHLVAEAALIEQVAESVTNLNSGTSLSQGEGQAVARVLRQHGLGEMPGIPARFNDRAEAPLVSAASMLLATRDAGAFRGGNRLVRGISRSALGAGLYESPRYFAWLAAIAAIGAAPRWVGPIANDLGRRITWHPFMPPRGAGRLLWACEYAARSDTERSRALFLEARQEGCLSPDMWQLTAGREMSSYIGAIESARAHVIFSDDHTHATYVGPNTTCPEHEQAAVATSTGGDVVAAGWLSVYGQVQRDD